MNLHVIQLVPQPIWSQDKVFVLISQFEVGHKGLGFDIGACEHCEFSEIILFVFEIKVAKWSSRLKSTLYIASATTSDNVFLTWK